MWICLPPDGTPNYRTLFPRHNYIPKGLTLCKSWLSQLSSPPTVGHVRGLLSLSSLGPQALLGQNARTGNCSLSRERKATKETFTKILSLDQEGYPPCLQDSREGVTAPGKCQNSQGLCIDSITGFQGQGGHGRHSVSLLVGLPLNLHRLLPQRYHPSERRLPLHWIYCCCSMLHHAP